MDCWSSLFLERCERTKKEYKQRFLTEIDATIDGIFAFFMGEFNLAVKNAVEQQVGTQTKFFSQSCVQAATNQHATLSYLSSRNINDQRVENNNHETLFENMAFNSDSNLQSISIPVINEPINVASLNSNLNNTLNSPNSCPNKMEPVAGNPNSLSQLNIDEESESDCNCSECEGDDLFQNVPVKVELIEDEPVKNVKRQKTNMQTIFTNCPKVSRKHRNSNLVTNENNENISFTCTNFLATSSLNGLNRALSLDDKSLQSDHSLTAKDVSIAVNANILGQQFDGPQNFLNIDLNSSLDRLNKPNSEFACLFGDCERTFHKKRHLIDHQRAHMGIKPFRCKWTDCQFDATQRSNVIKHIRNVHFNLPVLQKAQRELNIRDERDPEDFLEVVQELL